MCRGGEDGDHRPKGVVRWWAQPPAVIEFPGVLAGLLSIRLGLRVKSLLPTVIMTLATVLLLMLVLMMLLLLMLRFAGSSTDWTGSSEWTELGSYVQTHLGLGTPSTPPAKRPAWWQWWRLVLRQK